MAFPNAAPIGASHGKIYLMIISESKETKGIPKISVVCCLHGNEKIGALTYAYFAKKINELKNFRIILANSEAVSENKRFIDSDMNRSFPGSDSGNHEERAASSLLKKVPVDDYVLDIHSTTSPIGIVAILPSLDNNVKRMINCTDIVKLVVMKKEIVSTSLIGQYPKSISIEAYQGNKSNVIEIIENIILCLQAGITFPTKSREVYFVDSLLGLNLELPKKTSNYEEVIINQKKYYPILYGEINYKTYNGFLADRHKALSI